MFTTASEVSFVSLLLRERLLHCKPPGFSIALWAEINIYKNKGQNILHMVALPSIFRGFINFHTRTDANVTSLIYTIVSNA